jgi:hypothetical protein
VRVFADTSAFVALAVTADAHHKKAAAYFRALSPGTSLVTTEYILDETITRIRRVAGHAIAVSVGRAMRTSTLARIHPLERADLDRAWDLFEQYDDKQLSFTDCTSFAFCERLGVKTSFTFDDDFAQAGLDVVPGEGSAPSGARGPPGTSRGLRRGLDFVP